MIQIKSVVKRFGSFIALDKLSLDIQDGCIYGLVGPNGSGKSTLMRLIAGVYKADGGEILVDNEPSWENPSKKSEIFYLSDDLYFPPRHTPEDLLNFYRIVYPNFSDEICNQLKKAFPIDVHKPLNTFSKGMRRQAALLCALSCCPKYLLLDEAFDGLDPVIRLMVKKVIAQQIADRGMSVVITSHNLRELEDLCDHIGLLHKGSVLFQRELDSLKYGLCKVQAVFGREVQNEDLGLNILKVTNRGSVREILVRGESDAVLAAVQRFEPVYAEVLPLTLEEVFIGEMEAVGYDYSNVLE